MLLAITLDKQEYKPGELSGLYASITLGRSHTNPVAGDNRTEHRHAIHQHGAGGAAKQGAGLSTLLKIPEGQELVAIFRMGYKDANAPAITLTG